MKNPQSNRQTDLVFGDLKDALSCLNRERHSPVSVRRSFGSFIDLSQKLTSAMRRDFSNEKGGPWVANRFSGWNEVTNFFKDLRNIDQHEFPIQIQVHQRSYYAVDQEHAEYIVFEGTWPLGSPFSEEPPEGVSLTLGHEQKGNITEINITPSKVEFEFIIHAQNKNIENKLNNLGTSDIHILSERCFNVLSEYHRYFCIEIEQDN